ncbi:unnamed protein product [Bemisia tabaci]|uniref:Uncharacterized protein n=1 Tax=Bemisia tabaci TaxID=7038 RepID=A0A9P0F5P0_BEMTA|nr:unnamed protein product [Bemisia tabaci]
MEKLPLLPGFTFKNVEKRNFQLMQQFDYKNGYPLPKSSVCGIGKEPLDVNSILFRNNFTAPRGHRYLNVTRDQENINIINKTAGTGTETEFTEHGRSTERHGYTRASPSSSGERTDILR